MMLHGTEVACGGGGPSVVSAHAVEVAGERGAEVRCIQGSTLRMPQTVPGPPGFHGSTVQTTSGHSLNAASSAALAEDSVQDRVTTTGVQTAVSSVVATAPAAGPTADDDWVVL